MFIGFEVYLQVFGGLFAIPITFFFLQIFKIVSHLHAQKVHRSKFQFFVIFKLYYDFLVNILTIKTKDALSTFRKERMGLILHIMSSKVLIEYTDTVFRRR